MTNSGKQGWRDGYAGSPPRSNDSDYRRGFDRGRTLQISEYDDARHGHKTPAKGNLPRGYWSSCLLRSLVFWVSLVCVLTLALLILYELMVDTESVAALVLIIVVFFGGLIGGIAYWIVKIIPK